MLSAEAIKKFIDDDSASEKKRRAAVGQRYYEGEHDIRDCRLFYYDQKGDLVEDKTRSNIKISHPFFTELVDQLASYMLSFTDNPIQAKETAEGLQEHLDEYFDEDFWAEMHELIVGTSTKGFEYVYAYRNEEDRTVFECADGMGVVEVRAQDTDDKCKYIIYWYTDRIAKGNKTVKKIQVWTETEVHFFEQVGNGKIEPDKDFALNPRPHVVYTDENGKQTGAGLGYMPFWRMDNGRKQFSSLKPIKALIDDYDLHACSLSNNLKDFDTPLHVVKGFQGENLKELQQNLKTKKIVGVDAEGGIDVQTVEIPYQARKEKLDIDEKNIYRFGFGLNTFGLKDTSATTNIAIKAAYSLLEMKAEKMEKKLKKLLKDLIKVVLTEINTKNKKDYTLSDIEFNFERNIMVNEKENAEVEKIKAETQNLQLNTVLNAAATLDDETVLQAICDILEIDYEEIKNKVPKADEAANSLFGAKNTLEGMQIDDEEDDAEGGKPLNNGAGNAFE